MEDDEDDARIAGEKRLRIVKALIAEQADVNFRTEQQNMTALHWAAYMGDAQVLEELLDHGAAPVLNKEGNSPVDIAGFTNQKQIVQKFCESLAQKLFSNHA